MRSGPRLLLLAVATVSLVATGISTSAPARGATTPTDARSTLVNQLSGSGTSSRFLATEQAVYAAQQRLTDARAHLDQLNTRLKTLTRQIADDEATVTSAREDLAALLRATYESANKDGFATAIISSDSFTQAIDRLRATQQVTGQLSQLEQRVSSRETALVKERADLQADFTTAQQVEHDLNARHAQLMAAVAERDISIQALNLATRQAAIRLAALDSPAGPVLGRAPCGNHFSYGQCTWYVASRRCIPWFGNADEWLGAARAMGYATGSVPRAGAVAVWFAGSGGASYWGHVAYVEAVGPAGGVPAGSFLISEMNWGGFAVVNRRILSDGDPSIAGFVYDKA